jgi:signal transduction histidine kinase
MAKQIVIARRKSSNDKKEIQVQTIAILASSIVHELKNYLAAINICTELSENKLRDIKKTVSNANYVIGNLQQQIKGVVTNKLNTKDFRRCSIAKDIEETLEQYPFKAEERQLITVENSIDFEYKGNSMLTKHIFYNLIKNALRAIANAGKGNISIRLESGVNFNKLIFRDTAMGIAKEFLPKMFKLFESQSTSQGGIGVGLAFCKLIMQAYDGDIVCDSVEGKYTEFTLTFPCLL